MLTVVFLCAFLPYGIVASQTDDKQEAADSKKGLLQASGDDLSGGGYAAAGMIENVGYSTAVYDANNGLPTSDANYILSQSNGFLWVGSYSGIFRYDGSAFKKVELSEDLTNGRGLFEDSLGRIWVGTNDNGVVVIDKNTTTHITYKDGLPSSSIRVFAQDSDGNVFIGTTSGICYADMELKLHQIEDKRLADERVLKLDSDSSGRIYGSTRSGLIFMITEKKVTGVYSGDELGMGRISTLLADKEHAGKVYLCTDSDEIYYCKFGADVENAERISVSPLTGIHWISYDCGCIWVSSTSAAGYIDDSQRFHLLAGLPMNSGIEMMTSDYQGNMWFASSTQGVMKIVANNFVNLFSLKGMDQEVTNTVCRHNYKFYIGTDDGLRILDAAGNPEEDKVTDYIGDARVRCIKEKRGNLWIGTYSDGLGLVCYQKYGMIRSYTTKEGMPDDEIRCISVMDDGTLMVGTNGGLALIKDRKIIRTVTADDGIKNTVFLTVEQGENGAIYVGTDGDGMYVIDGDDITRIGMDEGLTSDVVSRIKKDEKRGIYWIITSNSIMYMKNGNLTTVKSFPANDNYDLYFDENDEMWVISAYGLYVVDTQDMLKDEVREYRLYTLENGLTGSPTSYPYGELTDDGNMYIPVRNGICRVNINRFSQKNAQVKADVGAIYCDDQLISAGQDGSYTIPSSDGRIRIDAAVLDYTLMNPMVNVYLEGKEDEGITAKRSELKPLEYTGLKYGTYTLHIRVFDNIDENQLLDETFTIVKKPRITELPILRMMTVMIIAAIAGFTVWRIMKGTVISRQYEEIKRARQEADRAQKERAGFLANMSEKIRTPINTIISINELAIREDAAMVPKAYHEQMLNYSGQIKSASQSLLSFINDLFEISAAQSGRLELVEQEYDTMEMIRNIVSIANVRNSEKELSLGVTTDEMLPARLYGDMGKIKQIVVHLLTNAIDNTSDGSVEFDVSMTEREDDSCMIRFIVTDTGRGFKKEELENIFVNSDDPDDIKRSVTGNPGHDIARRFAGMMGGTFTLESEYKKGSKYTLTVRQKIIDQTPAGRYEENDIEFLSRHYIPQFVAPDTDILVVEDDPVTLTVIKGLLKPAGVFISTAKSINDCIEKLKDTSFDVVLLEHTIAGSDSSDALLQIRHADPDIPVYFLTADTYAGEDYYREKGYNGCLIKPIDSRALERIIMKHLPPERMEIPEEGK